MCGELFMKRKRVLYAEDDPANRKLLQIKLERVGIGCDVVEDGRSAMKMFEDCEYDALILDQYMPEMDGEEVAATIRCSHPDIPLIAVTSDDSLKSDLFGAGFDEVLVKPLRGNEIVDLIKSHL